MNTIRVDLTDGNPYNSGAGVSLDLNDGRRASLGFNIEDYARVRGVIDEEAAEFAYFSAVIYACDRTVLRDVPGGDRWTREFSVEIPVADPVKWQRAASKCESAIGFLTGDIWHLEFVPALLPLLNAPFMETRRGFRKKRNIQGNAVMLFSGGLDSLIGAIDWLEDYQDKKLVLASTYDAQAEPAKTDQKRILPQLDATYRGRIQYYVARAGVMLEGKKENSFRSRSLAFIGNAIFGASFLGSGTPIVIPENGAIAINYPLTPARRGSLSTRTVHPHFVDLIGQALEVLGIDHPLANPYRLKTKGEMMQECRNKTLLKAIYADSASCGKRGRKGNWNDTHARQCGVCVPCIYRRAAVQRVGYSSERYGYDLLSASTVQKIRTKPNHDLLSVLEFIERNDKDKAIWRTLRSTGHLDPAMKANYIGLVKNLRGEVKDWAYAIGLV
jgi:7-cyano-7-deazaguanine synthase in queuosine biosynthesis